MQKVAFLYFLKSLTWSKVPFSCICFSGWYLLAKLGNLCFCKVFNLEGRRCCLLSFGVSVVCAFTPQKVCTLLSQRFHFGTGVWRRSGRHPANPSPPGKQVLKWRVCVCVCCRCVNLSWRCYDATMSFARCRQTCGQWQRTVIHCRLSTCRRLVSWWSRCSCCRTNSSRSASRVIWILLQTKGFSLTVESRGLSFPDDGCVSVVC